MKNSRVLLIGGCGYIGSATYYHLKACGYEVDTVDTEIFGNVVNPNNIKQDYGKLTEEFLSEYDVITILAAHSSAYMCNADPYGAFRNNVVNFVELLPKLDTQKLIYASSSCVYSGSKGGWWRRKSIETDPIPRPCDNLTMTKATIDWYVGHADTQFYGLRFGSVNGYSPNLRRDLVVNSMTIDAINRGSVHVSNKESYRPIVSVNTVVESIERVISAGSIVPGIYNVANFNIKIGDIAKRVAKRYGAKVIDMGGTPGYDFLIDSRKFIGVFGMYPCDLDEIIEDVGSNYQILTKRGLKSVEYGYRQVRFQEPGSG